MDLKNFLKLVMEAIPEDVSVEFDIRLQIYNDVLSLDANGHNLKFTIEGKSKRKEEYKTPSFPKQPTKTRTT